MDGPGRITAAAIDNGTTETSIDRRESQVVIQQLGELHDHQRVSGVGGADIVVNVGRNHASAG